MEDVFWAEMALESKGTGGESPRPETPPRAYQQPGYAMAEFKERIYLEATSMATTLDCRGVQGRETKNAIERVEGSERKMATRGSSLGSRGKRVSSLRWCHTGGSHHG